MTCTKNIGTKRHERSRTRVMDTKAMFAAAP
jgi:hypothetical protein